MSAVRSNHGGRNRPACAPTNDTTSSNRRTSRQRDLLEVLRFLFCDVVADLNGTHIRLGGELLVVFVSGS
jgi:hypothetical protein